MNRDSTSSLNPQKVRLGFLTLSGLVALWSLTTQSQFAFQSIGGFVLVFLPLLLWLVLGSEYLSFVVRARSDPSPTSTIVGLAATVRQPRANELDTLVSSAGPDVLDDRVVWTFVRALLGPKGFYERISERVELGHVSLIRRVSYSCDLLAFRAAPQAKNPGVVVMERVDVGPVGTSLVVPLHLVRRGSLGGGLRVLDEGGKGVSTVGSYDLVILQLGIFRSLVKKIAPMSLPNYVSSVEPDVSAGLRSRTLLPKGTTAELLARFNSVLGSAAESRVPLRLLELLLEWHPVCVTVPARRVDEMTWPETIRYTVERRDSRPLRDQTVDNDESDGVLRALDGLRLLLGVPINRFYVSLADADRTRSYHLEVCGPVGTYVARQAFAVVPKEASNEVQLEAFVTPRQGQRRARAQVTQVVRSKSASNAKVFFAVKFFERTPGSFGVSTVASALLTLATWLLFFASLNAQTLPPTVAGFLLTLPAAAVALSGLDSRREYRQASLLSMGLNGAMLLAVSASIFVLLVPVEAELGIEVWRVIAVCASFTFLVSVATWSARASTEQRLRRGGDSPVDAQDF